MASRRTVIVVISCSLCTMVGLDNWLIEENITSLYAEQCLHLGSIPQLKDFENLCRDSRRKVSQPSSIMVGDPFPIAFNHRTGNCHVAITPIRLLNETITCDSAYWHDIWLNAQSTLSHCVDLPRSIGGYHHIGARALVNSFYHLQTVKLFRANFTRALLGSLNRLILTLYASGSTYDTQILQILDQSGVVCSKEAVPWITLAQDSDNISGSISCGSSIELVMQESLSECCNTSTGQIQSIKRGKRTFCSSCGASLEANS